MQTIPTLKINGHDIDRIEYRNEPVITLKTVDQLHERPDGTARRNFNQNKNQFIENEDFFDVPYEEWHQMIAVRNSYGDQNKQRNPIKFLTQIGYLMLVKSFKDDLAWKVQRMLVRNYFGMQSGGSACYDGGQSGQEFVALQKELLDARRRIIEFQTTEIEKLKTSPRKRKKLSENEKRTIREMTSEGCLPSVIGRTLGRPTDTVRSFLRREGVKPGKDPRQLALL